MKSINNSSRFIVCIWISSVITRGVCINFFAFVRNLVVFLQVPLSTSTGHLDWQATSSNRSLLVNFIGLADRTDRFQELCYGKKGVACLISASSFFSLSYVLALQHIIKGVFIRASACKHLPKSPIPATQICWARICFMVWQHCRKAYINTVTFSLSIWIQRLIRFIGKAQLNLPI